MTASCQYRKNSDNEFARRKPAYKGRIFFNLRELSHKLMEFSKVDLC